MDSIHWIHKVCVILVEFNEIRMKISHWEQLAWKKAQFFINIIIFNSILFFFLLNSNLVLCLAITSVIALDPCNKKTNKCPPGAKHVACKSKTAAVSSQIFFDLQNCWSFLKLTGLLLRINKHQILLLNFFLFEKMLEFSNDWIFFFFF